MRYFHQKASNRRQKNGIQGLFDATGVWHSNAEDIEHVVVDYFTSIFTSNGDSPCEEI